MARFRDPGGDPNEIRARELAHQRRLANPGYQLLNAGLSTMAKTLGALAVNAASYEWFGGKEKTELEAKKFVESNRQFQQTHDLGVKQHEHNVKKQQHANAAAAAEIGSNALTRNLSNVDPSVRKAAMSSHFGPKTKMVEYEQTQEPKPAVNVVQIPGGGPAYEVSDPETSDFGYEGKHYKNLAEGEVPPGNEITLPLERKMVQREEAIDYFKDLSQEQRQQATALRDQLSNFEKALAALPQSPARDALIAAHALKLGMDAAAADQLRARLDEGRSLAISETSTAIGKAPPPTKTGGGSGVRGAGGRVNDAKNDAAAYLLYKEAMDNPNVGSSPGIIGNATPEQQQKKLERLKKRAIDSAAAANQGRGYLKIDPANNIAALSRSDISAYRVTHGRDSGANKADYMNKLEDPATADTILPRVINRLKGSYLSAVPNQEDVQIMRDTTQPHGKRIAARGKVYAELKKSPTAMMALRNQAWAVRQSTNRDAAEWAAPKAKAETGYWKTQEGKTTWNRLGTVKTGVMPDGRNSSGLMTDIKKALNEGKINSAQISAALDRGDSLAQIHAELVPKPVR